MRERQRPHQRLPAYIAAVRAAGRAGMTTRQLAERFGLSQSWAVLVLRPALAEGSIVRTGGQGKVPITWYAAEHAPAPRPGRREPGRHPNQMPYWSPASLAKLHRHATLDPRAPAVVPAGARITPGPSGKDSRYTVDHLPPGHASPLDPHDCRPWAAAATTRQPAADKDADRDQPHA